MHKVESFMHWVHETPRAQGHGFVAAAAVITAVCFFIIIFKASMTAVNQLIACHSRNANRVDWTPCTVALGVNCQQPWLGIIGHVIHDSGCVICCRCGCTWLESARWESASGPASGSKHQTGKQR